MSQSYERIVARLNNLQAIEPLLGALRTISMGTWQMAQNKLGRLADYQENYHQVLAQISPLLKETEQTRPGPVENPEDANSANVALLIGTERGLCGRFNENLVESALQWMESQPDGDFRIWAMGSRVIRSLGNQGIEPVWSEPLNANSLGSYRQAYLTTQQWAQRVENAEFSRLSVLHQKAKGEGKVQFAAVDLFPFDLKLDESKPPAEDLPWPPPIIETDPEGIYQQIRGHFIASTFYRALLESAIAEHSSRFILLEDAKKNTDDIITDLNRDLNIERKRKITRDMQELAIGAGLIDNK
jgi:F-type H+-transporting ATPase subunit gamma